MGLSRNKVAVPEGVAGTPPFWSEIRHELAVELYEVSQGDASGMSSSVFFRLYGGRCREFLHYFQNPKAEALIINRKGNEISRIFVSLLLILNLISTAASAQSTHMHKGSHEASVEMTEIVDRLFFT